MSTKYVFDKNIYDLELHEKSTTSYNLSVMRVPGGWIYYKYDGSSYTRDGTFVPYDNEFKPSNRHWRAELDDLNALDKERFGDVDFEPILEITPDGESK